MITMRWADEITLIAVADPAPAERVNANGFPIEREQTKTTVFGNVKSVGYSEFWKAAAAGVQTQIKADVHTEEYGGQRAVEISGKRYKVLRTFTSKNGEITELTLTDLSEAADKAETSESGAEGGGDVGEV